MISLLGEGAIINDEKWFNDMLEDLNIKYILFGVKSVSGGYEIEEMYRMFPKNKEMMEFRRTVTKDMEKKDIRELFEEYSRKMKVVRGLEKSSQFSNISPQRYKFHCDALGIYFEAIGQLKDGLSQKNSLSPAIQSILEEIKGYLSNNIIMQNINNVREVKEFFRNHSFTISVGKDFLKIRKTKQEDDPQSKDKFGNLFLGETGVKSFSSDGNLLPIEKTLVQYFEQNEKVILKKMKQLWDIQVDERFLTLEKELQFYLSFFKYIAQFEQRGYEFCLPELADGIEIEDGYDFALAGKELSGQRRVITNCFRIEGKERMVVITGANGGGKTTYARMAGEILFFSNLGLLVPAKSAKVPFFGRILTHFSTEESEKTGRGKLLEELHRLKPLFENKEENQFVILNELFTTAATKDALEMGECVMDMVIDRNMRGVYVTHIQGLAKETDHVVSMVAELCEDHKTRSYKISRRLPNEEEYEDSIIEKHHLLEGQIKEVLSHVLSK